MTNSLAKKKTEANASALSSKKWILQEIEEGGDSWGRAGGRTARARMVGIDHDEQGEEQEENREAKG